ncbi:hypothetical protein KSP40_PGU008649 [Platanthera guangdongensis]|uniref:Uncharacterized protein n=1 Tax=Platanthera guangdongensis TaxID=2320717 RepID=A0ABR2MFB6_9ASPA
MASEFPIEVHKESSFDPSSPANPEVLPPEEEPTLGGDQAVPKKGEGKGDRRPSRERKSVQRFSAQSPPVISATKAVVIEQGSGEKLKDIPNGLNSPPLKIFCPTVHFLKRDILQFSGFVWSEDKEDVLAKLLEFLESPHVTREVVLAEKDKKGTKRKRGAKRNVKRALEETSPDKQRKWSVLVTGAALVRIPEVVILIPGLILSRNGGGRVVVHLTVQYKAVVWCFRLVDDCAKKKEDLKGEAKEGLRDPAKANKISDKGDSIDQYDERADEEINSDDVESSELSKDKEKEEETEHEPESTKKMSDGNEDFESEQNSPTVRKVYHEASKTVPPSPKKVDIDDESELPSEDDADFLKDTKGSSMVSATSKKVMQSPKKKIDTDGKSNVSSKRTGGLPKKTSSTTKNDKADNSKKKVSMKVEAKSNRSKKDDEKKGKSSTRTASEDTKGSKKQSTKAKSSTVGNNQAKEKNVSVEPSAEQLSTVVGEILKQVDFNVATLADIIRQLGSFRALYLDIDLLSLLLQVSVKLAQLAMQSEKALCARFDTDLMHRKTEIKQILEEVINNMTDEEDADGDNRVAQEGEKN